MTFEEILYQAKQGDEAAIEQILETYRPLLLKNAMVNGRFDEDLYMELVLITLKCIRYYN